MNIRIQRVFIFILGISVITLSIFLASCGQEKIDALIGLLEPMGIKKLARSGVLALYREID